jgi:uncharacterized protein (DUF433 family)
MNWSPRPGWQWLPITGFPGRAAFRPVAVSGARPQAVVQPAVFGVDGSRIELASGWSCPRNLGTLAKGVHSLKEGIFVPPTETEIVAEQNVVEVPLYTYLDAARYLHVPVWVALSVSDRLPHYPIEFFERFWHEPHFRDWFEADYWPNFRGDKDQRISFRSLASLFVSSAVFRPLLSGVPFPRWHPKEAFHLFELSHEAARKIADDLRLLANPDWVLSRYDRIADRVPEADRAHLLKLIALHQSRVESKEGVPVRLFPFSRDPAPDAPRSVAIDPEVRFGRPTVKGAPTDVLAERWRAGDNSADLAEDYGLMTDEVDEALRYEATPYQPPSFFPFFPFMW